MTRCPDEQVFVKYLHRQLPDEERAELIDHVSDCSSCRLLLAGSVKSLLGQEADAEELGGRYRIGALVAMGGMGVVCEADDSRLKRKVALKLIRRLAGPLIADQRERLVREAESLARLSHPNIVTIYDAGALDEQLFIAMELVRGGTLATWCAKAQRSWRQILEMFLGAARGLAAAHRAGVVHRDFKPDNVLIGEDGRPRVADFGLARLSDLESLPPSGNAHASPSLPMTLTGVRLGTPRYMSPEQHQGKQAGERSDQFSFAVALYEALYGEHPFDSSSAGELSRSVCAGAVRPPSRAHRKVPGRLRAVLLRALSVGPEARFPSMDALVEAAERHPTRVRPRMAVALSTIVLAALGVLGVRRWVAEKSLICKGQERVLAGVWDEARREKLQESFAATGLSYAPVAARESLRLLDSYASQLVSARTEACEATRLRGEQSAAVEDLRLSCLDERTGELRALTDVFLEADADAVREAVRTADGLGAVSLCSDVEALAAPIPPPADPAVRKRIAALNDSIAKERALSATGKLASALPMARQNVVDARTLGWPPLTARALIELAHSNEESGDFSAGDRSYHEVLEVAEAARADEIVVDAASALAMTLGMDGQHFDEARGWVRFAQAALERAGNNPDLAATVERTFGIIDYREARYADSLPHYQRALAILEKAGRGESGDAATALNMLAGIALEQARYDDAESFYQRALALYQRRLGAEHPETVMMGGSLASVAYKRGQMQKARALYSEELHSLERLRGPDDPENAFSRQFPEALHARFGIALVLHHQGKLAEARALLLALLSDEEQLHSNQLTHTLSELGELSDDDEEAALARGYYARALALSEKQRGADHPETGVLLLELAASGDPQAAADAARALSILEKTLGPTHEYTRGAAGELGLALVAKGDLRAALPLLERTSEGNGSLSPYRFALAETLVRTGGDRVRARSLAEAARDDLRQRPTPKNRRLVARIDRWLARD